MSNLDKAIKATDEIIDQYDEMLESEPSHDNMFDVGQDVASEAAILSAEAKQLQNAWLSLKQKWSPHREDSRYQSFVEEFEKLLLPKKLWVFNSHDT